MKRKSLISTVSILVVMLASPLVAINVAHAKSDKAAIGIGKNGDPPGQAKAVGESASAYAPGHNRDASDDEDEDDDDGGVVVEIVQ